MSNRVKGALSLIGSSTAFALMSVFVKLTGGVVSLFQQIFFRNIVMLVFAGYMIYKNGQRYMPARGNRGLMFFRCLFGYLALLGNFYAVNNLYLGDAQALQKLAPIFVTIFAVIFLGESFTRVKVISLLTAFLGALLVVNPKFDARLVPAVVGVLSSVLAGMAYTMVSYLQRKEESEVGNTIIFNFALLSCILSFGPMARDFVRPDLSLGVLLLMIGVLAALGQYLLTRAYRLTEASSISIYDYSGVVVSAILGLVLFKEYLPINSLLGILIIILSGYISFKFRKTT